MPRVKTVRLKMRTRIQRDGLLEIRTPTPLPEGDVEVELRIRPVPRLPKGTPGYKVAKLAGSISDTDAEEMLRAIEEGCEQVDESQW